MKKVLTAVAVIVIITVFSCDDYDVNYALYSPDPGRDYTITFNADGGMGTVPSPMTVHADSIYARFTLPSADLYKDGLNFVGWREPGYTFLYHSPGKTLSIDEDTELTAAYENESNITAPGDGDSSGFYVTRTGNKYHKYGHMGATIPLSQGKNGPYTACKICF
jgi:hypothetical protein